MSLVFVNGNSARCRDCQFFEYVEITSKDQRHDGRCLNKKYWGRNYGSGKVHSETFTCFGAEAKDGQMMIEEMEHA